MIPLSGNDRLLFIDEKNGITFFIKPIVGENEEAYLDIMEKFKPGMTNREQLPILNELFNFLVIGWECKGKGKEVKAFPSDGNPARLFHYKFKDTLTNHAIDLNGLGIEETKN